MKFSLSLLAVGLVLPAVLAGGRDGGDWDDGHGHDGGHDDNHHGGHGGHGGDDGDCTTTSKTSAPTSIRSTSILSTSVASTSIPSIPTPTPSTCAYLGCYSDPLGFPNRQLTFNSQVSEAAQTRETCQKTCTGMGLKYAGLEYNFECWCGDVLHNNDTVIIDPTKCTYPCSGNANETCGGQEYMDLYDCSAILPPPEEYNSCVPLGCYTDVVSDRALKTSVQGGDTAQSNGACTAACIALGYRFAGTEYGKECWCANEIGSTGVPALDGNEKCNMPCSGNSTQICGGQDRLNVFDCQFPVPTPSAAPSASASATVPASVVTVAPTSAPCPPKLVSDFHGCFGNKRSTDSDDFCYEWLDAAPVAAVTSTMTRGGRHGARDLRYHGEHGAYGGKTGNSRAQSKVGQWPGLGKFNDDEIDRACRCHVGQWWEPKVVTKTVGGWW